MSLVSWTVTRQSSFDFFTTTREKIEILSNQMLIWALGVFQLMCFYRWTCLPTSCWRNFNNTSPRGNINVFYFDGRWRVTEKATIIYHENWIIPWKVLNQLYDAKARKTVRVGREGNTLKTVAVIIMNWHLVFTVFFDFNHTLLTQNVNMWLE